MTPHGKTITIGTFTDRAELPEVAQTLQQQLQKAGFKVKLDVREYANIESDALAGEFDAFILSRATVLDSGDPAAYLYSDFASKGSFNISQLSDKKVDAALDKAAATKTGDARRRAVIDAEAAVLATDAAVPMLHERVIQGDAAGCRGRRARPARAGADHRGHVRQVNSVARLFTPGSRAALTRLGCLVAVLAAVGLLPWLSGRDPALTVLRARSAEQEGTPEALAAIRADLGLDAGPLSLLGSWVSGLPRGDLGTSWVSGTDVLPSVVSGLQVSLALMGAALGVALLVTCALVAPVLVRGRGSAGAFAAMLVALPEFLLATVALLVCGVWLGWLPTSGWQGPQYMVLPALALGVPAGGLLGRLVADALPAVLDERWVELWRGAGVGRVRVSAAALRRVLPPLVPQFGMVAVGLTGGAVAVETVFAVPGIGRTALGAAKSQDLPLLQGSVLALLALGLVTGAAAALVRRRLLGPALRDAGLTLPAVPPGPRAPGRSGDARSHTADLRRLGPAARPVHGGHDRPPPGRRPGRIPSARTGSAVTCWPGSGTARRRRSARRSRCAWSACCSRWPSASCRAWPPAPRTSPTRCRR